MDGLVVVKTFRYRYEADIARSFLETEQIPSTISAGDIGGMYPGFAFSESGVSLLVREEDAERAVSLLEQTI